MQLERTRGRTGLQLRSDLEVQRGNRQPVLILRIYITDGGIGLLQLRLTEFDNRAEAKLIAALGEAQTQVGFPGEFRGPADALKCRVGRKPGGAKQLGATLSICYAVAPLTKRGCGWNPPSSLFVSKQALFSALPLRCVKRGEIPAPLGRVLQGRPYVRRPDRSVQQKRC